MKKKEIKSEEIKYDGSDEEMIRLGLMDESGVANYKRPDKLNKYMHEVYIRQHPEATQSDANFPTQDKLEEYFEEQRLKKEKRVTKRRAFFGKIFGRNK